MSHLPLRALPGWGSSGGRSWQTNQSKPGRGGEKGEKENGGGGGSECVILPYLNYTCNNQDSRSMGEQTRH